MFAPLRNPVYRQLFAAQILSLIGTGLATVALGLLAFDLAGAQAGAVLGTALTIKMVAYVGVAPVAGALAARLPRRRMLVTLDLLRAGIALALPFVDQIWQIYLLIFVLQSASAAFTPAFQATIPDILPDEAEYTRALSLSRLAYDLESLISPVLAAALLTVVSFHWLFAGTSLGFVASGLLVLSVLLPPLARDERREGVWARTTRGVRIYLATPRLRGLLALTLCVAAAGAMVIVNTVVWVQALMGRPEDDVALALAAFGAGSIGAALTLPRLLDRMPDRAVTLAAAGLTTLVLALLTLAQWTAGVGWWALLAFWAALGAGYSATLTPAGRLLRRSSNHADRPALFAAQFALSHLCWLVAYPLAGWAGARLGMGPALLMLSALAVGGLVAAHVLWRGPDLEVMEHRHDDMPPDHPHLTGAAGRRHAHPFHIDDYHSHWPRPA